MRSLFFGVVFIIVVGFGGLVYRNAVEHPAQQIVCPLDAKVCPDGTSVSRVGTSCTFAACPLPNIALPGVDISFALPAGLVATDLPDTASVAAYALPVEASSTIIASITIRRYTIEASSTPLATIQQTAVGGASGLPVSATSFTSTILGNHRFTVVSIERFEGVIDTAYYLARGTDVLRFDAIDRNADWTNPNLDLRTLPAHAALTKLLVTLQGQ
ncbi:MAG: hypothetical protein WC217_03980 [Candidatus Paceibacterota bacterium]|jgi:hypothetical protein